MKKIVLYSSSQLEKTRKTGGVKRFLELLNYLGNYCQLTLLSGDKYYSVPEGVRHISMHQEQIKNKESAYAKHNYKYLKKIKKEGYDSIISFDVPPAIWLTLFRMPHLCLMIRKDLIGYEKITLHDHNVKGVKRALILKAFSIAELLTLLHAEKIIVQCKYDRDRLIERHTWFSKIIRNKIKVQINNVNPSWANASVIKKEKSSAFRIASVNGFSDSRKGCDIFLEAVSSLIDQGKHIEAFIAGDGRLLSQYKEEYKKYSDIHFVGRISNPGDWIKQFDLAVVPSRADSCPNTVMEALLNNVPVIASNVGGIPEIIEDKIAMFELSAESLKNRIIEIYNDKSLYDSILEKQKKRAKELEFDWAFRIFQLVSGER